MPKRGFAIKFGSHFEVLAVEVKERMATIDHPGQRQVGQGSVRVSASYVGVCTWEPALFKDDG